MILQLLQPNLIGSIPGKSCMDALIAHKRHAPVVVLFIVDVNPNDFISGQSCPTFVFLVKSMSKAVFVRKFCPLYFTVFCPGFQKGRVASEKRIERTIKRAL